MLSAIGSVSRVKSMGSRARGGPYDKPSFTVKCIDALVQGITLAVNGLLISGKIISERDFILSNGVLNTLDEITEELAREAAGFGDVERSPHEFFIHLKEAKIFAPGQKPIPNDGDGDGVFWRVKLSSVDGFLMASLAASYS